MLGSTIPPMGVLKNPDSSHGGNPPMGSLAHSVARFLEEIGGMGWGYPTRYIREGEGRKG